MQRMSEDGNYRWGNELVRITLMNERVNIYCEGQDSILGALYF